MSRNLCAPMPDHNRNKNISIHFCFWCMQSMIRSDPAIRGEIVKLLFLYLSLLLLLLIGRKMRTTSAKTTWHTTIQTKTKKYKSNARQYIKCRCRSLLVCTEKSFAFHGRPQRAARGPEHSFWIYNSSLSFRSTIIIIIPDPDSDSNKNNNVFNALPPIVRFL